jgi:hypothetical protein
MQSEDNKLISIEGNSYFLFFFCLLLEVGGGTNGDIENVIDYWVFVCG